MITLFLSLLPQEYHALFQEFHRRYEGKLYAVALNILKNPTMAEDAVSAAMLKVVEHFDVFMKIYEQSREKIGPWAVTIVKNTALDLCKKENRNETLSEEWDVPIREDTESEAAYHHLIAAIRSMPETYRQVLELKFVCEYSAKEISYITGLSVVTINNRVSRGRALLQKKLRMEGYGHE